MKHFTHDFFRLFVGGLLLLILLPAQATVRASFDRPQVIEGDPVILTISQEGGGSGSKPDLTPLEKDFVIEGSSQSSQISIINGRRTDRTYWSIRLLPKHLGTITVPPIQVGNEQSPPLTLEVKEVPEQTTALPGQPLFLEMEADIDKSRSYVQQQIPLTIRLLYKNRLQQGSLSDPAPDKAVVERLGEDKQYRTVRNGEEYNVIERHYAIFPEKSGELRIPPVIFRGRVAVPQSGSPHRRRSDIFQRFFGNSPFANDPFFNDDFFSGTPLGNPGRPVTARSRALTIQVAPRPDNFQGEHWLPAEAVELEDSWRKDPPRFRVGEPVTRTITLQAKGLEASQIPPLDLPQPGGFRLYADQPVTETRTDGSGVYGINRRTFTYVPKREGRQLIPEYRLHWWNTLTEKEDETLLPQWQINVEPGANPAQKSAPAAPAATTRKETAAPGAPSLITGHSWDDFVARYWPALLTFILALGLLILLWYRKRGRADDQMKRPVIDGSATSRQTERHAREALKQACTKNDPQAAAKALLELAAIRWPDAPPRNLAAVAARLIQGGEEIRGLERALYAAEDAVWQGQPLWQALKQGLVEPEPENERRSAPLPPLYPGH